MNLEDIDSFEEVIKDGNISRTCSDPFGEIYTSHMGITRKDIASASVACYRTADDTILRSWNTNINENEFQGVSIVDPLSVAEVLDAVSLGAPIANINTEFKKQYKSAAELQLHISRLSFFRAVRETIAMDILVSVSKLNILSTQKTGLSSYSVPSPVLTAITQQSASRALTLILNNSLRNEALPLQYIVLPFYSHNVKFEILPDTFLLPATGYNSDHLAVYAVHSLKQGDNLPRVAKNLIPGPEILYKLNKLNESIITNKIVKATQQGTAPAISRALIEALRYVQPKLDTVFRNYELNYVSALMDIENCSRAAFRATLQIADSLEIVESKLPIMATGCIELDILLQQFPHIAYSPLNHHDCPARLAKIAQLMLQDFDFANQKLVPSALLDLQLNNKDQLLDPGEYIALLAELEARGIKVQIPEGAHPEIVAYSFYSNNIPPLRSSEFTLDAAILLRDLWMLQRSFIQLIKDIDRAMEIRSTCPNDAIAHSASLLLRMFLESDDDAFKSFYKKYRYQTWTLIDPWCKNYFEDIVDLGYEEQRNIKNLDFENHLSRQNSISRGPSFMDDDISSFSRISLDGPNTIFAEENNIKDDNQKLINPQFNSEDQRSVLDKDMKDNLNKTLSFKYAKKRVRNPSIKSITTQIANQDSERIYSLHNSKISKNIFLNRNLSRKNFITRKSSKFQLNKGKSNNKRAAWLNQLEGIQDKETCEIVRIEEPTSDLSSQIEDQIELTCDDRNITEMVSSIWNTELQANTDPVRHIQILGKWIKTKTNEPSELLKRDLANLHYCEELIDKFLQEKVRTDELAEKYAFNGLKTKNNKMFIHTSISDKDTIIIQNELGILASESTNMSKSALRVSKSVNCRRAQKKLIRELSKSPWWKLDKLHRITVNEERCRPATLAAIFSQAINEGLLRPSKPYKQKYISSLLPRTLGIPSLQNANKGCWGVSFQHQVPNSEPRSAAFEIPIKRRGLPWVDLGCHTGWGKSRDTFYARVISKEIQSKIQDTIKNQTIALHDALNDIVAPLYIESLPPIALQPLIDFDTTEVFTSASLDNQNEKIPSTTISFAESGTISEIDIWMDGVNDYEKKLEFALSQLSPYESPSNTSSNSGLSPNLLSRTYEYSSPGDKSFYNETNILSPSDDKVSIPMNFDKTRRGGTIRRRYGNTVPSYLMTSGKPDFQGSIYYENTHGCLILSKSLVDLSYSYSKKFENFKNLLSQRMEQDISLYSKTRGLEQTQKFHETTRYSCNTPICNTPLQYISFADTDFRSRVKKLTNNDNSTLLSKKTQKSDNLQKDKRTEKVLNNYAETPEINNDQSTLFDEALRYSLTQELSETINHISNEVVFCANAILPYTISPLCIHKQQCDSFKVPEKTTKFCMAPRMYRREHKRHYAFNLAPPCMRQVRAPIANRTVRILPCMVLPAPNKVPIVNEVAMVIAHLIEHSTNKVAENQPILDNKTRGFAAIITMQLIQPLYGEVAITSLHRLDTLLPYLQIPKDMNNLKSAPRIFFSNLFKCSKLPGSSYRAPLTMGPYRPAKHLCINLLQEVNDFRDYIQSTAKDPYLLNPTIRANEELTDHLAILRGHLSNYQLYLATEESRTERLWPLILLTTMLKLSSQFRPDLLDQVLEFQANAVLIVARCLLLGCLLHTDCRYGFIKLLDSALRIDTDSEKGIVDDDTSPIELFEEEQEALHSFWSSLLTAKTVSEESFVSPKVWQSVLYRNSVVNQCNCLFKTMDKNFGKNNNRKYTFASSSKDHMMSGKNKNMKAHIYQENKKKNYQSKFFHTNSNSYSNSYDNKINHADSMFQKLDDGFNQRSNRFQRCDENMNMTFERQYSLNKLAESEKMDGIRYKAKSRSCIKSVPKSNCILQCKRSNLINRSKATSENVYKGHLTNKGTLPNLNNSKTRKITSLYSNKYNKNKFIKDIKSRDHLSFNHRANDIKDTQNKFTFAEDELMDSTLPEYDRCHGFIWTHDIDSDSDFFSANSSIDSAEKNIKDSHELQNTCVVTISILEITRKVLKPLQDHFDQLISQLYISEHKQVASNSLEALYRAQQDLGTISETNPYPCGLKQEDVEEALKHSDSYQNYSETVQFQAVAAILLDIDHENLPISRLLTTGAHALLTNPAFIKTLQVVTHIMC